MQHILKNLSAVAQSIALFRDVQLEEAGITGYQAKYLLAVFNAEGISQDGLAKRLLVNKSNVARQVGALEVAGYLKREQSAEDKRVMLVYTTDAGKGIIPLIRAANEKWKEVLCEGLSQAEREELASLLEKLVKNARGYLTERI